MLLPAAPAPATRRAGPAPSVRVGVRTARADSPPQVATVYDHDQLSANDLLGEVQLDLARIFADEGGIGCHPVEGDYLLGARSGEQVVGQQLSRSRLRSERSDESGICGKLYLSCRFQCRRHFAVSAMPPPLVQFKAVQDSSSA